MAFAILVLPGCGNLPTGEEPPPLNLPPTAPLGSVQPGTPGPPATQPTPTPSPSPGTPSPTPSPTASAGAACRLAPMPECGGPEGPPGVYGCCQRTDQGQFGGQVDQAIAQLRAERPDLFNGNRVLNEDAYVQGVARILERQGLCARQGGPEDEVAVKANNNYNEQYDILFSNGTVRTQGIVASCRPARF